MLNYIKFELFFVGCFNHLTENKINSISTSEPNIAEYNLLTETLFFFQGLLNRLTENNIKSISTGIESLYTEHSRHDTNLTLLTLLRDSLLTQTLTPEKMMSEHAMLITVLHANIGQ